MEYRTIWAGIPKKLVRKSDGMDFGSETTLGYTYYIGDEKLEVPIWELEEHYERVEIPLEDLRLGMIFKTEEGEPYTIVSFNEDGKPIYQKGEIEVEIPEGYWEQFEPKPIEEEPIIEELETLNVGDIVDIPSGGQMRCVGFDNGEPM